MCAFRDLLVLALLLNTWSHEPTTVHAGCANTADCKSLAVADSGSLVDDPCHAWVEYSNASFAVYLSRTTTKPFTPLVVHHYRYAAHTPNLSAITCDRVC